MNWSSRFPAAIFIGLLLSASVHFHVAEAVEMETEVIGSASSSSSLDGCPVKCSCLGEYVDCTNIKLKTVPVIADWIRSL